MCRLSKCKVTNRLVYPVKIISFSKFYRAWPKQ
jgi:hypothetical protein